MKKNILQRKGFTLVELLIGVTITVVIVGVLIGVTRLSIDTWKETSDRVQAASAAKESLDVMARDFEGIVIRGGNNDQWLYAKLDTSLAADQLAPSLAAGSVNTEASIQNPMEVGLFSAVTDRYDGQIGTSSDLGGDISAIFYRLVCKDVLNGDFPVYALYRHRVNPNDAFTDHIGKDDLASRGSGSNVYQENTGFEQSAPTVNILTEADSFLARNIYNLNMTFVFKYTDTSNVVRTIRVPVMKSPSSGASLPERLNVQGDLVLVNNGEHLKDEVLNGDSIASSARLVSVELGMLVINDSAMGVLRNKRFSEEEFNQHLKEHSHYFTKTVILPGL